MKKSGKIVVIISVLIAVIAIAAAGIARMCRNGLVHVGSRDIQSLSVADIGQSSQILKLTKV